MYNTAHVIQSAAWMYIVIHYKFIGWEKTDFDSSWCTHTFRFLKVCSFQAFIGWSVQEMAACKVQLCKHRYFRRSSCFLVAVGLRLGIASWFSGALSHIWTAYKNMFLTHPNVCDMFQNVCLNTSLCIISRQRSEEQHFHLCVVRVEGRADGWTKEIYEWGLMI